MNRRIAAIFLLFCIMSFLLIARLSYISTDEHYVEAAVSQSEYRITISSTRGSIYDRDLRPLAGQITDFRAVIFPGADTKQRLREILGRDFELSSRLPFVISVDDGSIGGDDAMVFVTEKRYSEASLAAHLVGYVNGAGEGAAGIERAYDSFLTEHSGKLGMTCRINALGTAMTGLKPEITDTTSNSDAGVVLTIDADMQLAVERIMEGKKGAAVITNLNGEVLACASCPSFSQNDIAACLEDEDSPLYNRAFAAYDLGSVFKLVTAAAALENGIGQDYTYECTGNVQIGTNTFHCSNRNGHGELNMSQATACSCNTYFINLAAEIGGDKLLELAQRLGFGERICLADNLYTESGCLPTSEGLQLPAALANFSFGQGELMATPIHIASLIATIAQGGEQFQPYAVLGLVSSELDMISSSVPSGKQVLSSETCAMLRSFMRASVTDGTASSGECEDIQCAAKTGTAQTGISVNGKKQLQAWYAGFFPYDNPKYVCVVVIEDGTSGGADAGPIFKNIAETVM